MATPYFAPSYFAPPYFTPSYFGGPAGAVAPPELPSWLTAGDLDILADIRGRLDAAGTFAEVAAGMPGEDPHESIAARPLAIVSPASADEDDTWEDLWTRTLKVRVTILAEGQEPQDRHDELDRLARGALNALTRQSLGDLTMPARTKATGQGFGPTRQPDQSAWIDLNCPYLFDPAAGRPVGD